MMKKRPVTPRQNGDPLKEISQRESQVRAAIGATGRAFAGLWLDVLALGGVSSEEWAVFTREAARLRALLDRCESFVRSDLPHFPHRWLEAEVGDVAYCRQHFCTRFSPDFWYRLVEDYAQGKHSAPNAYRYHGDEFTVRLTAHDDEKPRCSSCTRGEMGSK